MVLPAHGRLVVNRSTTRWIAPAGTQVLAVLDDAGHGWVAAGVGEHLRPACAIVLSIVVEKGNAFGVVILARLLAVRTTRLRVDN